MTTFAPHRDTVEFFVDCMHGGADKDALSGILAEDVVMYGPLGDEPLTGREAVLEAIRGVGAAADLTYREVLSGETHHAAYFRLQIEDTAVDGMDYILLDADGKIAEVTIWWRPLPAGVQMQGHLAALSACSPGNCARTGSDDERRAPPSRGLTQSVTFRQLATPPHFADTPPTRTQGGGINLFNASDKDRTLHEQHQHHRHREHGPRHRHAGGSGRQHRRGHRPRSVQGR